MIKFRKCSVPQKENYSLSTFGIKAIKTLKMDFSSKFDQKIQN